MSGYSADQFAFGPGDFFAVPLSGSDLTPVMFNIESFELDIKFELKKKNGRGQFPLKVARGKGSVAVKMVNATVNGAAYNRAFFGSAATETTGQLRTAVKEVLSFTAGSADAANKSKFQLDLGAWNVAKGIPLKKVDAAGTPVAGEYKVVAGAYTCHADDIADGVICSYTWKDTTGTSSTITNQPMGTGVTLKGIYTTNFEGRQVTLQFNNYIPVEWKMATKLDDFSSPEFSGECAADISDTVGVFSFG